MDTHFGKRGNSGETGVGLADAPKMTSQERIFVSAVIKYLKDLRLHKMTRIQLSKHGLELEAWGQEILDRTEKQLKEKKCFSGSKDA